MNYISRQFKPGREQNAKLATPFLQALYAVEKGVNLSERDYLFWRQLALDYSVREAAKDQDFQKETHEMVQRIEEDARVQRTAVSLMKGQLHEVQRKLSQAITFLETMKQTSQVDQKGSMLIHVTARASPYPNTRLIRYPVPEKYVPWEITWLDYDPVAYTKPKLDFPGTMQDFVDVDILLMSQHPDKFNALPQFQWNTVYTSPAGVTFDRTSWIVDASGANLIYI